MLKSKFLRRLLSCVAGLLGRRKSHSISHRRPLHLRSFHPLVETLETRVVPAIYNVTSINDNNGIVTTAGHAGTLADPFQATTLRGAIFATNNSAGADIIIFDPHLTVGGPAVIAASVVGD